MQNLSREKIADLRKQYPPGSAVVLQNMVDDPHPIPPGTSGKLMFIDDAGDFHIQWSNGRTLAAIYGVDQFSVTPPETLKFYMPLVADEAELNEYGDWDEDTILLDGRDLVSYGDEIFAQLASEQSPEDAGRGIMTWYGENDSVDEKVLSAVFTAEIRNGQLWGVAECRVVGKLTNEELDTLREYLTGQASDGFGEGFEQRPIRVGSRCEIYVHLWNFEYNWSIKTEEERFGTGKEQKQTHKKTDLAKRRRSSAR